MENTESDYLPGPVNTSQESEIVGSPSSKTAVPLSLKTSTITNYKQCTAAQSSYNSALAQFTDSVNSAVRSGVYVQSIVTSVDVITYTDPEYSYSLDVVDTETFNYAWTTWLTTTVETIAINTLTLIDTPTFSGTFPICATEYSYPCGGCTLAAASLQLIYWPVSTAEGNPSFTISWNGTTPRVGLFDGTPFTSGSVYLKYAGVSAINSCSVLGGGLRAGPILTLASDAISSLVGDGTHLTAAQSFNYANLNYPYAWGAYKGAHRDCYPSGTACQFEVSGGYNPYISLPQQLRNLDPAWAHCTIAPNAGSWDPPYALQPIDGTLTPPSPIYTQGPMVGATPVSPIGQSTTVSIPIATSATGLPQPKPWTPVPVAESTLTNSPIPASLDGDSSVIADPSANMNLPPESALPLPSPQRTPIDSPPTNPASAPAPQPPPTIPPIITFQGNPFTAETTTAFTIGSQTLIPGGPSIIVSSTNLSLAPSATALAIGGATIPFQLPSPSTPPKITIGDTTYTADSASAFIVGTQTLRPGGPAITNAGTVLSLAPSATAITVGDVTVPLQPPSSLAPVITIGPSVYTASSSSFFVISSQTLFPSGSPLTISGTVLSLFPSATAILLAGSIVPLSPPLSTTRPAMLIAGTATYTATTNTAGDLVIGTQTLHPGGTPLTISGTVISLFPSGTAFLIAGSTIALSPPLSTIPPTILTLGTTTDITTTDAAGDLVIGTQTLLPGEAVTVAGTVLSLDPAATEVVIGGTKIVPVAGGVVTVVRTKTVEISSVVVTELGEVYTGLGGVVVSEFGATPTGEGPGSGGWIRSGVGRNATGGIATGLVSGSGIGVFVGGAVGRDGVWSSGWGEKGKLIGVAVGLGVVVGIDGL